MKIFVVSARKKTTHEIKLLHIKFPTKLYEEDHGDCEQKDHQLNSKNGQKKLVLV